MATIWQTLHRWNMHYKRGRRYVHSPDGAYAAKMQWIETITWSSHQAPELQATVQAWLEQWADASPALLRYVGLCPT